MIEVDEHDRREDDDNLLRKLRSSPRLRLTCLLVMVFVLGVGVAHQFLDADAMIAAETARQHAQTLGTTGPVADVTRPQVPMQPCTPVLPDNGPILFH